MRTLPISGWITLAILIVMFAFLIWNKLPSWLVFVGTLTVAITLKLAPAAALLKGYSNTGVVTVAALYPVAAGMYSTGAISLISEKLIGLPKSILAAQLKIFVPVTFASAFLYNTPLVAMMIPAVRDLTRKTGLQGSKLFMGLSYMAILGGTITLIGTAVNLIIAGLVVEAVAKGELPPMKPIGLFDQMWIGIPAALTGLTYMILIGSRLLHDRSTTGDATAPKRMYRSEFRIEAKSSLDGKTVEQAGFAQPVGFQLESIRRNGSGIQRSPETRLEAGDRLIFSTPSDVLPSLWTTIGLVPAYSTNMTSGRHDHQLVELILSPQSPAIGHRVSDLPLPNSSY
jgi:hypothetical protein